MPHLDGALPDKKTLRTLFLPTVLPPAATSDVSPLQNKLLKYRRCNEEQKMVHQLLIDRALKIYHKSMEEKYKRDPVPSIPRLPSTMNSKQKQQMTNYLFLKKCVLRNPVVPIQQQWLTSILSLVPQSCIEGRELVTEKLIGEIIRDYEMSVRRFVVQKVLIKPNIKGLEEEEEAPLPLLPLGLDFSRPWHNNFIKVKKKILPKLHILHPIMKNLLDFSYAAFSNFLIVDFSSFRLKGPVDCESLKTEVSLSCAKAEEKILNTWYQKVISLFSQKEALKGVKLYQTDSFFNCVSVLMSNQLKELLRRTVEAFVKLFDSEDRSYLPLFKMNLTLDEKKMELYPSFQDLEEGILFLVNRIGQTFQNIQTVRSWLAGGTTNLDTELPNDVIELATSTLKKAIRENLQEPKAYFENYVDKYGWLVDGTAQARIERFEAEEHTFEEYTVFIDEFFTLKKEISSLPVVAHFPMICLNCEDLKQGLASNADTFAKMLMDRIVANYREENEKICREFEEIKERALQVPETTEEMVETIAYVKKAKTKVIQDLSLRVKGCFQQMIYFLDNFLFTPEDIALNAEVLLWPKVIKLTFDDHDELFEQAKCKREEELIHTCEKLTVELDKLTRSVTELEEYSELDHMQQYVADVGALQKHIQEADETVALINKEETLLERNPTDFPLLNNLKVDIEPYQKIFNLILKWQQTEKRLADGILLELNGENMEAGVDELFREIHEMSKLFKQKQKKIQQEQKKTSQGRTVEDKTEEETKANPILTMCSSVLEQIKDFKLRIELEYHSVYLSCIYSLKHDFFGNNKMLDIMKHCAKDPKVLVATSLMGLLEKLQNCHELLEKIIKGLDAYQVMTNRSMREENLGFLVRIYPMDLMNQTCESVSDSLRPTLSKGRSRRFDKVFDADSDDEIPTQRAIQESLEDRHKIETSGSAKEFKSFQYIASKEHDMIIEAIRTGQEEALMKLVRHSFAFEEADQQGWLPLHEAAAQLNKNIFEITLKASCATVQEQTTLKGETPLLVAVRNCFVDNVRILLLNGCNPNVKNEEGDSPLIIAIKHDSYEIASLLISFGSKVNLQCVHKRTALHEAARIGRKDLVNLLLHSGADPDPRSGYGLTPLALAAQAGHTEIMELLLQKGADVLSQAMDCASVLFEAAGGGNPDALSLLLEYGADANVPKHSGHLPIHRAAYRGHFLALKKLVPVTNFDAIKESGISPVHSAAAGAQPQCLEFLLKSGFDANFMLDQRVRKGYDDHRKSALYFAVSNGDICSTQLLLNAGALTNQDPINCLQIALRMGNYELMKLLLRHGANVNYFCRVNTTHFPSALQYALKDEVMLRMLMNYGYDVHRCFDCPQGNHLHSQYVTDGWTPTVIKDTMFCEVITLSWLKHLSGKVVRVMLDYVDHINICGKLEAVLREQELWPVINLILRNPRSLKHLCRLKIRECMGRLRLRCPVFMTFLPLPNCLKDYILYKEYDLYGQENFRGTYNFNCT